MPMSPRRHRARSVTPEGARGLSLALLVLIGCGSHPAAGADAGLQTDTAPADTSDGQDVTADSAAGQDVNAAVDASPAFDCADYCGGFKACAADVSESLCVSLCSDADTANPAQKCLTTTADCDSFVDCMLGVKLPIPKPTRAFDEGTTGIQFRDLAGDFTVPTDRGDWNFKAHYDGNDAYLFVMTGRGWYVGTDGVDYGTKLHDDATTADLHKLLTLSPKNTHWFFIAYPDKNGADDGKTFIDGFKQKFDAVLAGLSPLDRAWWRQRLHFVTAPAPIAGQAISVPANLGGWLGDYTTKRAPRSFAIDRYQRLRQIGLLSLVGQKKWFIQHLAYEAQHYNYEVEREKKFPSTGGKVLVLLDGSVYKKPYIDVVFPPASEMATYDTLEIDHAQMCKDHDDKNCFEWDYISWLKVAERPKVADNAYAKMSCTVAVKEVKAAAEVLGACVAGANKDKTCKVKLDCPDSACKGYKKAVSPVSPVVGDTQPCTCITPRQAEVARVHTCGWTTKPTATAAGVTGYKACGCETLDLDVQRWITTYRREGRWISDASHALYHFAKGGTVRFRYQPAYPYTVTLKLRLRNKKKGYGAPAEVHKLFGGGAFNQAYNDKYAPRSFLISKDAKRVEIVLDVSGHGFGKDTANCAEFCNHTHHFTVKSSAGQKTWVRTQPYVGDNYGCAKQVAMGAVPNQFGTWTLGRGGWCPGMEVPVTVWDVTAQTKPGDQVTISYTGMLGQKPYVPVPYNSPGGGFGGRIDMKSWLLIYK